MLKGLKLKIADRACMHWMKTNNDVHGRGATEEVRKIQAIKEVNSIALDGESSSRSLRKKEGCLRA